MTDYDKQEEFNEKELQEECKWFTDLLQKEYDNIELPDSLRSENLIHKLDELTEEDPLPKPAGKTLYFKYISMAACFVLVCAGVWGAFGRGADGTAGSTVNISSNAASAEFDDSDASALLSAAPALAEDESIAVDEAAQEQERVNAELLSMDIEQPTAKSYDEVYAALSNVANKDNIQRRSTANPTTSLANEVPAESAADSIMMAAPAAGGSAKSTYSGTNVQISGVDEADIVKTDGKSIYHYRFDADTGGAEIAITDCAAMKLTSSIQLEDYSDSELYIYDNRLVVVSQLSSEAAEKTATALSEPFNKSLSDDTIIPEYYDYSNRGYNDYSMVSALCFDVSDRSAPKQVYSFQQDGRYLSSRMKDDTLYLVSTKRVYHGFDAVPLNPISDYVPYVSEQGTARVLNAENIIIPPYVENVSYTVVSAIDLNAQKAQTKAVLGAGDDIMMSNNSLFLAADVYSVDDAGRYRAETGITRFLITGDGLKYIASAKLLGSIDNQFSLDEYKGRLRVAVTATNEKGQSVNRVHVLDSLMKPVGVTENMAEGERIYSVRYIEDTAYVVTFRETDPLFVVDLSNPTRPVVKGQLKIPGFSEYLHPINENTLLGFGVNTISTVSGGVIQDGLKLSLFDVSDPTAPKETATFVMGNRGSSSEVLNNHKAFMYYPQKNLVGFPASIYTVNGASISNMWGGNRELAFDGYIVLEIKSSGFEIVGTIPSEGNSSQSGFMHYEAGSKIDRGLYVNDTLYTVSNAGLMSFSLDGFTQKAAMKY